MKRKRETSRKFRFAAGHNVIKVAASAAAMCVLHAAQAQPTLLYQWNFDGASPAQPAVSAGGGALGITKSANGSIGFSNTGGVGGGGMLDLSHNQQWGTLDPTGYASSADSGSALTGLGSMNHITISMWVKANSAGDALSPTTFPRLLELADIPNYDKDNNNPPPQASQNNNGVTLQFGQIPTGSTSKVNNYQTYVRGLSNDTSRLGPALNPDQWTLVVWTLDSALTASNNNPYYDPDMRAVNGGQFSGNQTVYTATETSLPNGFDGSATDNTYGTYPGTINFGSAAQIYFGNRGIGTPANPNPTSGDSGGMNQGFNGMIDNVRIFNGLVGTTDVEKIRRSDLGLPAHFNSQWSNAGDGDWLDGTKWSPGVPFITDDSATFGAQGGTSAHNINLTTTVRVGTITFGDSSSPSGNYTIGGSGVIILSNTDGGSLSTVSVLSGNHTINAQLNAGTFGAASPSPVFDIASGASLTLTNLVTFNAGPRNGVVKTGAGRLTAPRFTFGNLHIQAGTYAITPGNTAGGNFFKPYALDLQPGATLDLTNNNFVSAAGDQDVNTVRQQIAAAYGNGHWTGSSAITGNITSSTAAAVAIDGNNPHKTAVAYAVASTLTSAWIGGPNPGGSNVLLSYTLSGDADINGSVDSGDFNALATNFNQSGKFWVDGDFNYDGIVNALDFNAIATNYGASPAAALGTLIPEPASLTCLLASCLLIARRRHLRGGRHV